MKLQGLGSLVKIEREVHVVVVDMYQKITSRSFFNVFLGFQTNKQTNKQKKNKKQQKIGWETVENICERRNICEHRITAAWPDLWKEHMFRKFLAQLGLVIWLVVELNQPTHLQNMRFRQNGWVHPPQFSGWKFQEYVSCHHLGNLFVVVSSSFFVAATNLPNTSPQPCPQDLCINGCFSRSPSCTMRSRCQCLEYSALVGSTKGATKNGRNIAAMVFFQSSFCPPWNWSRKNAKKKTSPKSPKKR